MSLDKGVYGLPAVACHATVPRRHMPPPKGGGRAIELEIKTQVPRTDILMWFGMD